MAMLYVSNVFYERLDKNQSETEVACFDMKL